MSVNDEAKQAFNDDVDIYVRRARKTDGKKAGGVLMFDINGMDKGLNSLCSDRVVQAGNLQPMKKLAPNEHAFLKTFRSHP